MYYKPTKAAPQVDRRCAIRKAPCKTPLPNPPKWGKLKPGLSFTPVKSWGNVSPLAFAPIIILKDLPDDRSLGLVAGLSRMYLRPRKEFSEFWGTTSDRECSSLMSARKRLNSSGKERAFFSGTLQWRKFLRNAILAVSPKSPAASRLV